MRTSAQTLPGNRLHLSDGPIDLLIWADGSSHAQKAAYRAARERFDTILDELVQELPLLREPILHGTRLPQGVVAQRMYSSASAYRKTFVTPMIAVAGSVADEVLAAMCSAAELKKAYVNNGGDIAVHTSPGNDLRVGIVPLEAPAENSKSNQEVKISHNSRIGGIATSGCRGRSLSLGIADSVTVLAADAAKADVAATLIANQVYADHPSIKRRPAVEIDPDSDLGRREVTVGRGTIPHAIIQQALSRGAETARLFLDRKQIFGALLSCCNQNRVIGADASLTQLPQRIDDQNKKHRLAL